MPRISSSWIIHLQYMLGSSDSKDDPWSYLDGLTPLGVHQLNLFTVVPPCLSLPTNKFLLIIWPTPWAGKMNQILSCDWLPKRVRQDYLAHFGLPIVSRKKNSHESHNIRSFTDQACLVSNHIYYMAHCCSRHNACSDCLIVGHYSLMMPRGKLQACKNKAKSRMINNISTSNVQS